MIKNQTKYQVKSLRGITRPEAAAEENIRRCVLMVRESIANHIANIINLIIKEHDAINQKESDGK